MLSESGLCITECRELIFTLHNVSLCFIKRSANCVAHHLARASWLNARYTYWADTAPGDLIDVLLNNLVN